MRRLLTAAAGLTIAAFAIFAQRADAMPPFAQAYGVQCNVCHTQVPILNAYGRYVQRTGYAALDPQVLKRALPVWLGESANYDSQGAPRVTFGNVALHAVGVLGNGSNNNWTYHVQQWIVADNQSGPLDTLWLAYNNLLHRDGHLFIGKIEAPGPSPFSQFSDLAGFSTPEITVGEHVYQLDANRWGVKLNYVHHWIDAEAGWLGNGGDLTGTGGASDFSSDTDKTIQYKLAYADAENPLEVGIYGSRGSWPLAEGGVDQYHSLAGYVQRDPTGSLPGVLVVYQHAYDGNPGAGLGPANSTASTFELYEPVLGRGLISIRKEFTNDGLGNQAQSGEVNFAYHVARYLNFYIQDGFVQNGTPDWQAMLWWTTPLSVVK